MDPKVEKKLAILAVLAVTEELIRPGDVAEQIGSTALDTGNYLSDMAKSGLAEKPDKKKALYKITDRGREYLKNPPEGSKEEQTLRAKAGGGVEQHTLTPATTTPEVVVPSQADLFRDIGERLHIGIGRSGKQEGTPLDAVIYYVQRTANLDNLSSVWNALSEMGVASDVRKRWIKLYSQNLPGKEISAELKKKLEEGTEEEKVSTEKEVSSRVKFFNVIDGQIMPDPEGEYSFSQAVQKAMVEKGASSNQAAEMASTFARMNTDTINTLIPLISKESEGTSITQVLLAQMSDLQKELREDKKSPETDQQIQALSQQISDMRETLHDQELARIQEQNQTLIAGLGAKISRLEEQIAAGIQGKQAESKIGLMSETVKGIFDEAKGAREDLKSMAPTFLGRGSPLKPRSTNEKVGFGAGLDKGIKKAQEATTLEEDLFFGQQA